MSMDHCRCRTTRESELIKEQYDKIYRYCYFKLHNRELAEDITQETFLRYLEKYRFSSTETAMSIGESCLILSGIALVLSVLMSVFVMILSEILRGAAAALSVCTGCIILGSMVSMPPQYRVLAQIWDFLPFSFLERLHVFDPRTIPLFGHCFVSWQIVPVLYLLCSVGLAALGKRVYRRYQVSGR